MKTVTKRTTIRLVPRRPRDMTYMEYEYSRHFSDTTQEEPKDVIFEMAWNLFDERKVK